MGAGSAELSVGIGFLQQDFDARMSISISKH
jgi:hypothetical protein